MIENNDNVIYKNEYHGKFIRKTSKAQITG